MTGWGMRYFFFCLLFSFAWAAQGVPFRLATWNAHNYFDAIDDRYADQVPGAPEVERKTQQLALALRQINADAIALQEVEKRALLEQLAQASGYRYALLVEGNDQVRGIYVALLSRHKPVGFRSHKNDALPYVEGNRRDVRFSRDCLEVHLGPPLPMVILVNHLKSKVGRGKSSELKRRAQALRLQEVVLELRRSQPSRPVAVVGDMNDDPDSWPLEPLTRPPLVDPFRALPLQQRYTLKHRGKGVALDHILLTPDLAARVVPGSPKVGRLGLFHDCSDHWPLWLDLRP